MLWALLWPWLHPKEHACGSYSPECVRTGSGVLTCEIVIAALYHLSKESHPRNSPFTGMHGALQGSVLDGHKLVLQLSLRKAGGPQQQQAAAAKKGSGAKSGIDARGSGTKLVVRNVAFEATRKDVAALFAPFGQIKSCRLPKKFDGSHRRVGGWLIGRAVSLLGLKPPKDLAAQMT